MKITKLLPVIIILLICIIVFTDIYENFVGCYSIHTGKKINDDTTCDSNHCYCFNGTASSDSMCSVATTEHCDSCKDGYIMRNNMCLSPSRLTYQYSIEGTWTMNGDNENQFSKIKDGINNVSFHNYNLLITTNEGNVFSHGNTYNSVLGLPASTQESDTKFVKINIDNVKKAIISEKNSLFLKKDGSLYVSGTLDTMFYDFFSSSVPQKGEIYEPEQTTKTGIKDIVALNRVYGPIVLLKNNNTVEYYHESEIFDQLKVQIQALSNVVKIQGYDNTCFFIMRDGSVWAFVLITADFGGSQNGWQAGDLSARFAGANNLFRVTGFDSDIIIDIKIYKQTTLFLAQSGHVYILGRNRDIVGKPFIGPEKAGQQPYNLIQGPYKIKTSSNTYLNNVKEIYIGKQHALFLKNNGEVFAIGGNDSEQIDNSHHNYYSNNPYALKIAKYNNNTFDHIFISENGSLFVKINYTLIVI